MRLAFIRTDMSKSFLDILRDRIVVFDGAMGTNLHAQDLTVEDYGGPQFEGCPEHLLISKPEAVEKVSHAKIRLMIVSEARASARADLPSLTVGLLRQDRKSQKAPRC